MTKIAHTKDSGLNKYDELMNMPFDKYIEKFGPLKRLKKPAIDKPVENNRLRELLNKKVENDTP